MGIIIADELYIEGQEIKQLAVRIIAADLREGSLHMIEEGIYRGVDVPVVDAERHDHLIRRGEIGIIQKIRVVVTPRTFVDEAESALADHLGNIGINSSRFLHLFSLVIAVGMGFITVGIDDMLDPAVDVFAVLQISFRYGITEYIEHIT